MGHPKIASKMLPHFPEKTNKQIRDERKEQTYKNLLRAQMDRKSMTGVNTGKGTTGQSSDGRCTDPPGLTAPELHGPSMDATNEPSVPMLETTITEDEQRAVNTNICETNWITEIIDQTLSESPQSVTHAQDYEGFLEHVTVILRQIRKTGELPPPNIIDSTYSELVTFILPRKPKIKKNPTPTKGVRRTNAKRPRKKYLYGRSQELYKKNPGLLAKYIREGIDWLNDPVDTNPTDIQTFYTGLWSESPAIAIPFDQNDHDINELRTEEILCAITQKEIKTRLNKIKNGRPPVLTGWRRNTLIKVIQEKRSDSSLTFFLLLKDSQGVGKKIKRY